LKKSFVELSLAEKAGKMLLYKADSHYIGDNKRYFMLAEVHHVSFSTGWMVIWYDRSFRQDYTARPTT
jgi:hypothetical protein